MYGAVAATTEMQAIELEEGGLLLEPSATYPASRSSLTLRRTLALVALVAVVSATAVWATSTDGTGVASWSGLTTRPR